MKHYDYILHWNITHTYGVCVRVCVCVCVRARAGVCIHVCVRTGVCIVRLGVVLLVQMGC